MTGNTDTNKRTLPPLPHPEHLRKRAKVRLADMRQRAPSAKLGDAQLVLAREYGFATWAALLTEVAVRGSGPLGARKRVRRAHVAALYPERYRQDSLIEQDADVETTLGFFRTGIIAQAGFLLAALIGVAIVMLHGADLHALIGHLTR